MGAQGSAYPALPWGANGIEPIDKVEFMSDLQKAWNNDDVNQYKELWRTSWPFRESMIKAGDKDFDQDLLDDNVMGLIKNGLRHRSSIEWRQVSIEAARTFLYNEKARQTLVKLEFIDSLSLLTMSDDVGADVVGAGVAGGGAGGKEGGSEQVARNLLAVNIMSELADHQEFIQLLCRASILNFLCIVLNQVPQAAEKVTEIFVKLSNMEANLNLLREGSVGDILESTFKTCVYERPAAGGDMERWKMNVNALGNVARVLGTMIKYEHECQVETENIVKVFDRLGVPRSEDIPDCLKLLSSLARLFYWVCRMSGSVADRLQERLSAHEDPDYVLHVMVKLWTKCVDIHNIIGQAKADYQSIQMGGWSGSASAWDKFCTDDLDRSVRISMGSPEMKSKENSARSLLCYMNSLLWLCLAQPTLRWKLRDAGFKKLHLAFELEDPELIRVILSTIRHLVDSPAAQQCHELIEFFGNALTAYLDQAIEGRFPENQVRLLLDSLSILALQRGMQELFTEKRIWERLQKFRPEAFLRDPHRRVSRDKEFTRIEMVSLFIVAQVSVHPSNRMTWVYSDRLLAADAKWAPETQYPTRHNDFEPYLEVLVKDRDDTVRTVASLLLTLFQEKKFHQPAEEVAGTFKSVLEWWKVNSTTQYEAHRELLDNGGELHVRGLRELLDDAIRRRENQIALTSMETMKYCAPHECVLALSLFSRLALEPKFKSLFRDALEPLLGCVCSGIWAEAREAAATLANLMWMPDFKEERLVCWLKFDGPHCVAVDSANVLMPVKAGNPKAVEMGKGMYRNLWGVKFVEGSCVTLHPDGLQTNKVPGTLTSASASDTLHATSKREYQWLGTEPGPRRFTVTCWFYWPSDPTMDTKVLIQTTPPKVDTGGADPSMASVYVECVVTCCKCGAPVVAGDNLSSDAQGCTACRAPWSQVKDGPQEFVWVLVDDKKGGADKTRKTMKTPKLMPGWHFLAIVSSHSSSSKTFDGTKFWLDTWPVTLKQVWIKNDFYNIGNFTGKTDDGEGGRKPFGLIADFRIYADALSDNAVKALAAEQNSENHPDEIARLLGSMDAATILAQRLDVPDTAAECLRALGSLATLSSQRAKIYSVCGREVLKMLESPYPMIRRQAARLLANIA